MDKYLRACSYWTLSDRDSVSDAKWVEYPFLVMPVNANAIITSSVCMEP